MVRQKHGDIKSSGKDPLRIYPDGTEKVLSELWLGSSALDNGGAEAVYEVKIQISDGSERTVYRIAKLTNSHRRSSRIVDKRPEVKSPLNIPQPYPSNKN